MRAQLLTRCRVACLQRGRLTGPVLKAEYLADADRIAQQITPDRAREARLVPQSHPPPGAEAIAGE